PPSAGPAITPTWPPTPRSAIAPAICSSGTISRVMARAAGFPTTLAQPATAASTRNGQSEHRQRQELHLADEPEVERVSVDRVDLPADRDREHLRREAVRHERRPEEGEVADAERRRKA